MIKRCTWCGRIIPVDDIIGGVAKEEMVPPDYKYSDEEWETTCKECFKNRVMRHCPVILTEIRGKK